MGKVVGSVVKVLYGPVSGLIIDGPKGALQGLANAAAAFSGPITYGLYVGSAIIGSLAPTQKPESATSSIRNPIPPRVRAYGALRLYGAWALFGHKPDGTPVDVWAFHDGQANAILQIYLNDDKITRSGDFVQALPDGSYGENKLRCGYSLGLPTETAFSTVVSELPGTWTANHRGDGVVMGYLVKYLVEAEKFQEVYPNGDNIQMSLAGQWSLVFDFRDGAQDAYDPTTWTYSDNSVLAFLHYLITQRGVDFDTQILPQIDKWETAADICDETMTLFAGGTEKRYRLALAYKATDEPASVIAALLATFDGWYCHNERNEIIIYAGKYYTPTVSIGPEQIVSARFQEFVPAEDATNEITVNYVSADHEYNTVDAQPWRDEAAIAASGRQPVTGALGAQIPSYTQGRRLAKRQMIRANAPQRGSVVTTYSGRSVLGHRFINLRYEEAGAVFYDGPVEIVSPPEIDMRTGGLRFDWIAADPDIDEWDEAAEDGYGAPIGDVPPIVPLDAPTVDEIEISNDYESGDNAPGALLLVHVTGPARDDLTWQLRWRVQSTTAWNRESHGSLGSGPSYELLSGFVPVNSIIEVEVRYIAGDGRPSPWSTPTEEVDTTTPFLTGGGDYLTGGGNILIEES